MKTLHLVLKHKWYDMIASGEKKEEYREIKPYWANRLLRIRRDFACDFDSLSDCIGMLENETEHAMKSMNAVYKDYNHVCFHKGYTSTVMTFKIDSICIGKGKPEWGAPTDRYVFIIKIGRKTMKEKPILDACCGGRMFYFDKHDDRVLFQDIRKAKITLCDGRLFEVSPDVQADFTNMPYPDNSFSMVVFDPPHLVYSRGKKSKMVDIYGTLSDKTIPTGYQQIKYGALYSDWRDMLSKGFAECFRVLKHGGFLIFKWNETDIKVSEILKLTSEKPIFGHISGKRSNTHWICFMKK